MEIDMKHLCRILLILAIQAWSFAAYAADVEITNQGDNTTVVILPEPGPSHRGKPVNVWVSAVHDGVTYFHNGSAWERYAGGALPPAARGLSIAPGQRLTLAKGTDLKDLEEVDLYVGYGANEQEMQASEDKLTKVVRVGRKMRWPAPRPQ
jgi:hypothetical protein